MMIIYKVKKIIFKFFIKFILRSYGLFVAKMLNFPYDKFIYKDLVNSIKKNHINKVFKKYETIINSFN